MEFQKIEAESFMGGEDILFQKQAKMLKSMWMSNALDVKLNSVFGYLLLTAHYLAFVNSGVKKCSTREDYLQCKSVQFLKTEIEEVVPCNCWAGLVPLRIGVKVKMKDGSKLYFSLMKRKEFLKAYQSPFVL